MCEHFRQSLCASLLDATAQQQDQHPDTLTTQPFNIREKRSGEYQGTLTVTMLMGTQT
ncbi:hypothetical protein GQD63_004201, partial [Salmonella enterica]|nr:hypothetical protein [Salmonella enterica]EDV5861561.1 hypothetical protein [Salmonella enterica subsp. enterica serovar Javiana]EDQ5248025.1 hypothetical protein [Salmonella enterica]EEA5163438.1 hypothetical protein [Salmonella enterica]EEG3194040.1 hypothetical protein [Salmonella enterica]